MIRALELEAGEKLHFYLENATRFWLALVTAHSPRSRARLRAFAQQTCKTRGISFYLHRPAPEDMLDLSMELAQSPPPGMHWICLDHWLGLNIPQDTWPRARTRLLAAMNERREAYLQRLSGSIVIEGCPALKHQLRDMAPDLFSICAFMAEPSGPELIPAGERPALSPMLPHFPTEFVGRDHELEQIAAALHGEERRPVVVLSGPSGVGKSYLAAEYGKRRAEDYPDGVFFLNSAVLPSFDWSSIGERLGEKPMEDEKPDDYNQRIFGSLIYKRSLLIYDNINEFSPALQRWLPFENAECHLLLTTTLKPGAFPSDMWICEVGALAEADARTLLARLIRVPEAIERWTKPLLARAGGVTLELCALAKEVGRAVTAGREVAFVNPPTAEMESSLLGPWQGLPDDARFLLKVAGLFEPWALPEEELWGLIQGEGWDKARFERALDAACDRMFLVQSDGMLRMHPLVWAFVRGRPDPELSESLKRRHLQCFVDALQACAKNRRDETLKRRVEAYPADPSVWESMGSWAAELVNSSSRFVGILLFNAGQFKSALHWHLRDLAHLEAKAVLDDEVQTSLGRACYSAGLCHYQMHEVEAATDWFEQALERLQSRPLMWEEGYRSLVDALCNLGLIFIGQGNYDRARFFIMQAVQRAKQGDRRGRLDHRDIGMCLMFLGKLHIEEGDLKRAHACLEEAVDAVKKGVRKGRLDHQLLGQCMCMQGIAYMEQGNIPQACDRFQQAIKAHSKGDMHGRVSHHDIGEVLYRLGYLLAQNGQLSEARVYLEQALEAYNQGDFWGNVDLKALTQTQTLLRQVLWQLNPALTQS